MKALKIAVGMASTSMLIAIVALVVALNAEVHPYRPISELSVSISNNQTNNLVATKLHYCVDVYESALLTSKWIGPRGETVLGLSAAVPAHEDKDCGDLATNIPRPSALSAGDWRLVITIVAIGGGETQTIFATSNPITVP